MKITLIRAEKESRKEALSTLEADALIKKLKTETKAGHVSTLRAILPQLEGTCAQYEHIDKLPRIYPAVEYSRTQEGERQDRRPSAPRPRGLYRLRQVPRLSGCPGRRALFRPGDCRPRGRRQHRACRIAAGRH